MMLSLRTKVLTLPDDTIVLPGHGPQTTIGRERATNPFLQGLGLDGRIPDGDIQGAVRRRTGL